MIETTKLKRQCTVHIYWMKKSTAERVVLSENGGDNRERKKKKERNADRWIDKQRVEREVGHDKA